MSATAILLLAHGSRLTKANEELNRLVDRLKAKTEYSLISPVFMQAGEPLLLQGIRDYILAGIKKIIILPYFLSAGVHISEDIPRELEQIKKEFPAVDIQMTAHLGSSPLLAEIICQDIRELLR
jgi:sirohydrochlorin ferrochelatase